ncbi:hypothetical protein AcW1_001364 [Taiwanofungus camphoratus]|nr:hypothetical protein AcW1_001364 [Antrodia cinnamomea]
MKQTPEEKKETSKKKTPSKKKAETGSWPCKINGCNKVFAREADLKRHQRTTKLHSLPSFACPQCDATFTRTDALRRHQKSRHNGVIIPPVDQEKRAEGGAPGSSGSNSPSRSGTPSKSQGDPASAKSTPPTALAQPGTAGPAAGPSSYYRQHTMNGYPPPRPPPPPGFIDPHYAPPIALPTSATRLHQPHWQPSPPPPGWTADGHPLPPGMYHIPPPYYQPSPYYRHPPHMMPPHMPPPHGHPMHPQINPELITQPQNGDPVSPTQTHTERSSPASAAGQNEKSSDNVEMEDGASQGSAPVIDPSLDTPASDIRPNALKAARPQANGAAGEDMSLKITQAAVQAVIDYKKAEASRAASRSSSAAPDDLIRSEASPQPSTQLQQGEARTPRSLRSRGGSTTSANGDADADADADEASPKGGAAGQSGSHSAARPNMEHILTEDGETMLNPAELLTQESLASPPPS